MAFLKNRKSVEKSIEGNLGFGPRKRCTETVVNAHAEGNMIAQLAVEAEFIGIGKLLRVAVGGAEEDRDHFTLRDLDSRDLYVPCRHTEQLLDGALVSQRFFDDSFDEVTICTQSAATGPADLRVDSDRIPRSPPPMTRPRIQPLPMP
jgi:hypothetical protein